MPEQLPLAGLHSGAVAVSPLAVKRRARRLLRERQTPAWQAVAYLTDVALLEQWQARYRRIVRDHKRAARHAGTRLWAGRASVQVAASREGMRVQRAIREITERIQSQESVLCG
jgi:hypothetical protein